MLTCACMLFLKWYHLYVDNSFGLQSRLVKGLTLPEPLKIQGNFLDWLLSTGVNIVNPASYGQYGILTADILPIYKSIIPEITSDIFFLIATRPTQEGTRSAAVSNPQL